MQDFDKSLMPATWEHMMLSRLIIMPGVEHAVQITGVDLCLLVLKPRLSMVQQWSHIMIAQGILWSTPPVKIIGGRHSKVRFLVWSRLFLLSHIYLFPSVYLQFFILPDSSPFASATWSWHIWWCWSFWDVSYLSTDCCWYYCSKIKHNFSLANPLGIVSDVLAVS